MTYRVWWADLNPEVETRGSWDQTIVARLTAGTEFRQVGLYDLPRPGLLGKAHAAHVVVVAGQHNREEPLPTAIGNFVESLPAALTIITSDEESLFPLGALPHDDRHLTWVQYHARAGAEKVIPIGLPPSTESVLRSRPDGSRPILAAFLGQITHERRVELADTLLEMDDRAYLHPTAGFRQGFGRDAYLNVLRLARLAPCPSGLHSLDSFRLYEALAAGCLPVVETATPDGPEPEFWPALFGPNHPIPTVTRWSELAALAADCDDRTAFLTHRDQVRDWWRGWQDTLARDFTETLEKLADG